MDLRGSVPAGPSDPPSFACDRADAAGDKQRAPGCVSPRWKHRGGVARTGAFPHTCTKGPVFPCVLLGGLLNTDALGEASGHEPSSPGGDSRRLLRRQPGGQGAFSAGEFNVEGRLGGSQRQIQKGPQGGKGQHSWERTHTVGAHPLSDNLG